MRLIIVLFLSVFSLNASYQMINRALGRPWLASHLISKELILEYLNHSFNDKFVAVVDYEVCNNSLRYLAKTEQGPYKIGSIDNKDKIVPPLPFGVNAKINGTMYVCEGLYQKFVEIPLVQMNDFPFRAQIGNMLFLINKSGSLFKSQCNFFKDPPSWGSPEECGIFELGDEVQARFINCAKSLGDPSNIHIKPEVSSSLFLETDDGRILEMKVLAKPREGNRSLLLEDFDDFYPRVFRTKEQLEEEIRTGKCDAMPQDFVKRYKIPDFVIKFCLQYSKNVFIAHTLSIVLGGLALIFPKMLPIMLLILIGKGVFEIYLGTILKIISRQQRNKL